MGVFFVLISGITRAIFLSWERTGEIHGEATIHHSEAGDPGDLKITNLVNKTPRSRAYGSYDYTSYGDSTPRLGGNIIKKHCAMEDHGIFNGTTLFFFLNGIFTKPAIPKLSSNVAGKSPNYPCRC